MALTAASVHTGFWTANHLLVILNAVLASAAVATALVSAKTIKASNRVAAAAERQGEASGKQVDAALQELQLMRQQLQLAEEQAEHSRKGLEATARQLDVGRAQLDASRQAVAGSIRPLIVDVPLGLFVRSPNAGFKEDLGTITYSSAAQGSPLRVSIPLRNIGAGAAFVRQARLAVGSLAFEAVATRHVVPPAELLAIISELDPGTIGFDVLRTVLVNGGNFKASLCYGDLAGSSWFVTVVELTQRDGHQITVRKIELYAADENGVRTGEAIVTTGPG